MDRNLDGIYMRIKRGDRWVASCLSDMTPEELDEALADKSASWLRGAVKHLAEMLKQLGDISGYTKEY